MHVHFAGIGGAGIGPLALIAYKAGYEVSGSDKQGSNYIQYLKSHGIDNIQVDQDYDSIAHLHEEKPIDWFVYTSALPMEQPNSPQLKFCQERGIKATKRNEFLSTLLQEKNLKMVAIAGTHGKTTTTAMTIWLFKQLGIPISYSVGAKLSFGEMGEFDPKSEYFVYEADEFDRNFLAFHPHLALISGVDWDHPDIYPSREDYYAAFRQFISQSARTVGWGDDLKKVEAGENESVIAIEQEDPRVSEITLPGLVNRQNAMLVVVGLEEELKRPVDELIDHLNHFPGLQRRFEQIVPNLYSDYAHTPPKIKGALQMAHEVAGDNVVVIYEGLHNTRQHFIKEGLRDLFDGVKQLYIVPSYLAREDKSLALLSPADLKRLLSAKAQEHSEAAELNDQLRETIKRHMAGGDIVLCLTAGGGGSLDEWLRRTFAPL